MMMPSFVILSVPSPCSSLVFGVGGVFAAGDHVLVVDRSLSDQRRTALRTPFLKAWHPSSVWQSMTASDAEAGPPRTHESSTATAACPTRPDKIAIGTGSPAAPLSTISLPSVHRVLPGGAIVLRRPISVLAGAVPTRSMVVPAIVESVVVAQLAAG